MSNSRIQIEKLVFPNPKSELGFPITPSNSFGFVLGHETIMQSENTANRQFGCLIAVSATGFEKSNIKASSNCSLMTFDEVPKISKYATK